ncbi:exportin-7 [Marchantia polymorpha subsp. ruderalis]|uniref:Uncharacterized protein n=1 Tax=Marchantia polymorpha TaxID=3197 RepID=A0A2R6VWT7_MARPO|nr:hypothetical protein MARPO_YB0019 [Marchantia polymorpha]BBN20485.1 hypothetical protein Mp_Vg00310 [Marchantia polymorpha subsp. ruderalis]|eukprot:PTQ26071.1 hypothetical protein MARPO_YB0019 [Marchantia polymorpha]
MESLTQLEDVCTRLYISQDPAERAHAESTLQCFSAQLEFIPQCQYILDNSSSPYAQLLASSSLIKQVTEQNLTSQLRLDIRTYIANYLASKGHDLQSFVTTSLIHLLCRLSTLGWYEDDRYRDIVRGAMKFLSQGTSDHYYIGLKILNQLVVEMNQANPGLTLTQHRKTACSFRDTALLEVFEVSLSSLKQLKMDGAAERLQEQAMNLALKCLSFDFVGTSFDESSEELGAIQVPSSWRNVLEEPSTMKLFFECYSSTNPPLSSVALECLVRLASIRRSLFTGEAERSRFLSLLMFGTGEILRQQQGLGDHDNYHEFCRLLGRLKTNYQLSELISVGNYGDWIQLVAEFTIKSLQSWQWASGSVYYLLGLWSRLVSSVPYLKSVSSSLLEHHVFRITEAYITSRFDAVEAVSCDRISEDPLDSGEQLQDQLDCIPYLCRFQYKKTSEYIISLLEPIIQEFTNGARSSGSLNGSNLQVLEGQLTWMVHIIGSIIKGRQASSASVELQEVFDGELAARVFQLLQVMDEGSYGQRYKNESKQRLDLAILSFFQNFRRVYVGDQAMLSSKQLYARLTELLGLQDHLMVLNVIVGKISVNLKCYTKSEKLIEQTLNLFQELASGYMSGKLLLKLDTVYSIFGHHTKDQFPFLEEYSNSRSRTTFYFTLGRLLFMDDSPAKFRAFVAPFEQVLVALHSLSDSAFRSEEAKWTLVGLMRDLRGITMATNSRRTYGLLFDWLYPSHTGLLLRSLKVWTDRPEVTSPLLKFVAELVLNKAQRLTFESSSPNGILLFREVSKIVVGYGSRLLSIPILHDPYVFKYKGIWIILSIVTRALAGNYVNFGVFELYGDPSLSEALEISLRISLDIPMPDVLAFRKLSRAYFAFLEVLCHNHIPVVVSLERARFAHVVASLEMGLKCLDVSVSSQCASAVDNLATFYFNNVTGGVGLGSKPVSAMASHMADCSNLFLEILKTLFDLVLFEDSANQWSLSRPMLSIILVDEQIYNDLKAQLISTQPQDEQQRLLSNFDKLMADVSRGLEPKNRDRFTQNLTIFRHDFRAK